MLNHPKRDIVQMSGGREISFDSLPEGLAFDILEIPGKEELSSVLRAEQAKTEQTVTSEIVSERR